MKPPRQVIESARYSQQRRDLKINAQRLDEALEAVLMLMEADPPFFPQIPGTEPLVIRRARLADFPGLVPASIFYWEQPDSFMLLSIEVVEED